MDDYLTLSALQHYAYCPRQFALIHVEQVWSENFWTAEGRILHERVDSKEAEQRGALRTERSVSVISKALQIQGQLDLLEVYDNERYKPVEYKRGRPKIEDWDNVQLCAQALCLEEMRNVHIEQGALWYWQSRQREEVELDESLREYTKHIIKKAHELLQANHTPKPIYTAKLCNACSLLEICQPKILTNNHSTTYVSELFSDEKTFE